MSFICRICGEEHTDDKLSHDDVCIYCDTTLVDDANLKDGQLF